MNRAIHKYTFLFVYIAELCTKEIYLRKTWCPLTTGPFCLPTPLDEITCVPVTWYVDSTLPALKRHVVISQQYPAAQLLKNNVLLPARPQIQRPALLSQHPTALRL